YAVVFVSFSAPAIWFRARLAAFKSTTAMLRAAVTHAARRGAVAQLFSPCSAVPALRGATKRAAGSANTAVPICSHSRRMGICMTLAPFGANTGSHSQKKAPERGMTDSKLQLPDWQKL